MHLLDPLIIQLQPGAVRSLRCARVGSRTTLQVEWTGGLQGVLEATGEAKGGITLTYTGRDGAVTKTFRDSFSAFRRALEVFLAGVRTRQSGTPYSYLRQTVGLIEGGLAS